MKIIILAGGYGTRISEETKNKPKPLIKIGNKPIIWHIMKIYSHYGFNKFLICQGYKGYMFKKKLSIYEKKENWQIDFINTGIKTMTGGRIKRLEKLLVKDDNFCLTYGDGLCDVNIKKLINYHKKNKKIATVTAVKEPNRFGVLNIDNNNIVKKIVEKPMSYINGGFFVFSNKIFNYLKNDMSILEEDCLPKLSKMKQLISYKHDGFWSNMDNLRDKKKLEKIWKNHDCPWRLWDEK